MMRVKVRWVQETLWLEGSREFPRVAFEGVSPRALTRVASGIIFKAQAKKRMTDFVDPAQCDLFDRVKKRPSLFGGGAPTLLPFPWEE